MKIGGTEIILILALMIFVIGPERAVVLARRAGKWVRVLRVYIGSMTEELKETVVEPLQEMEGPLMEIAEPFNEISKETEAAVNGITKAFDDTACDIKSKAPEIELEMAEIIEDAPGPENISPARADIEEAGGN